MARFYGTLQGNRGEATRMGHPNGGLTTYAASWSGAIRCHCYDKDGEDYVRVSHTTWQGSGINETIYGGPQGGWPDGAST